MDAAEFAAFARGDRDGLARIRAEKERAKQARRDAVRARAEKAHALVDEARRAEFRASYARDVLRRAIAHDADGNPRAALPLYERWLEDTQFALSVAPAPVHSVVRGIIADSARADALHKRNDVAERVRAIRAALGIQAPEAPPALEARIEAEAAAGPFEEERPAQTLDDVCGYTDTVAALRNLADTVLFRYGDDAADGRLAALFFGVPGTGKTTLARALAGTIGCVLLAMSADDLFTKFVGESEKKLRQMFDQAEAVAKRDGRVVLFFDEVDRLFGDDSSGVSARVMQVMLQRLDRAHERRDDGAVFFVATTNHPWAIDNAFRRRLGRQIEVGLPDAAARAAMIARLCRGEKLRLATPIVDELAALSEGFSGADVHDCLRSEPRTIDEDAPFTRIGDRWVLGDGPDAKTRRELRALGAEMHLPPLPADDVRALVCSWARSVSPDDLAAVRRYAESL